MSLIEDRRAVVVEALSEYVPTREEAERLADTALTALDDFDAARVDLSGPPALSRKASSTQRKTVERLGDLTGRNQTALAIVASYPEGATCDQMKEDHTHLAHNKFTPALNYLENTDPPLVLRDKSREIKNASGNPCQPYEVTGAGMAVLRSAGMAVGVCCSMTDAVVLS